MGRVDFEVDRLAVDALVVARDTRRLALNLALDLLEVVEPPAGNVVKLGPFALAGDRSRRVRDMDSVAVRLAAVAGDVDELEDQRPASDDAAAAGQKVTANNVLEYG